MIYKEEHRDLFSVNLKEWIPVHCISMDCKMGAGIAVPMKKKFSLGRLESRVLYFPCCVFHNGVYNLVTKSRYFHKPSYGTLKSALIEMKSHIIKSEVKKIVMPKIGSGLDKLSWPKVKEIIQDLFEDIDIEILVCIQ